MPVSTLAGTVTDSCDGEYVRVWTLRSPNHTLMSTPVGNRPDNVIVVPPETGPVRGDSPERDHTPDSTGSGTGGSGMVSAPLPLPPSPSLGTAPVPSEVVG